MGGAGARAAELLQQAPPCSCPRTDCEHYQTQIGAATAHALLEIAAWLERIDDALRNTIGGRS